MKLIDILKYTMVCYGAGIAGYFIYLSVVIPYICDNATYQQVKEQCAGIDMNVRMIGLIRFIVIYIVILIIYLTSYYNHKNTNSKEKVNEETS